MNRTSTSLLDLPNEILFVILNNLNNMDVLYSLIGIGIERIDLLAQDQIFTNTLNFVSTDTGGMCSINDSILDRFYIYILPKIHYNVKCLVLDSMTMERILLSGDYPNLTHLKIFKFNQDIVPHYFTDESRFRRIFKQITDLILINNEKYLQVQPNYTRNVYVRIFNSFENMKHLSVVSSGNKYEECRPLSLRGLPSTTFFSSTLTKLCISLSNFEDCLALLDGRLKQLSTFIVITHMVEDHSSAIHSSDDLPNLKCFSLTIGILTYEYDTQVIPLLRRMCNIKELTLYLGIEGRSRFVDGTQLHNEILIHMARLRTFNFYIRTTAQIDHSIPYLSNEDIQKTFTNVGYEQADCILRYSTTAPLTMCHIFSLPFAFDRLEMVSNEFPNVIFNNVTFLWVQDSVPFNHEFFLRIAQSFPILKSLRIVNFEPQTSKSAKLKSENNQSYSVVEYPYITTLEIMYVHTDYIEQLLDATKTRLPRLTVLKIKYHQLKTVTENFTRDAMRLNCMNVQKLSIKEDDDEDDDDDDDGDDDGDDDDDDDDEEEEPIIYSKDFYVYFPVL